MFRYFKRERDTSVTKAGRPRSVGAHRRVYAIGDIHGRADLLVKLIDMIEEDERERGEIKSTQLIFLGDLINRGPESAFVIAKILELKQQRDVAVLSGNHEEVFSLALEGDLEALRFFLRMGGLETLKSYGLAEEFLLEHTLEEILGAMHLAVPQDHQQFIGNLEDVRLVGDYVFVHAGIRPGVDIAQQSRSDLRWIRQDFLKSRKDHSYCVVHGHTISDDVDVKENRIGIDTGAYLSGRLSALGLQDTDRWFLCAEMEQELAA